MNPKSQSQIPDYQNESHVPDLNIMGLKIRNFPKNPYPHFLINMKEDPEKSSRRNMSDFDPLKIFKKK